MPTKIVMTILEKAIKDGKHFEKVFERDTRKMVFIEKQLDIN